MDLRGSKPAWRSSRHEPVHRIAACGDARTPGVTGLWFHAFAFLLAFRLDVRLRAGRPIVPKGRVGRGWKPLGEREARLALLASRRAVARVCTVDSCLTRSIVLFQLLERRHAARLEIGFPIDGLDQVGHAWVTVAGEPLGETEERLHGVHAVR